MRWKRDGEKIGMAFGEREKCYLAAIQCEETQPDSQTTGTQREKNLKAPAKPRKRETATNYSSLSKRLKE